MKTASTFAAFYAVLWGVVITMLTTAEIASRYGFGAEFGSAVVLGLLIGFPVFIAWAISKEP